MYDKNKRKDRGLEGKEVGIALDYHTIHCVGKDNKREIRSKVFKYLFGVEHIPSADGKSNTHDKRQCDNGDELFQFKLLGVGTESIGVVLESAEEACYPRAHKNWY